MAPLPPRIILEIKKGATEIAASSIHCIYIGLRGRLDENAKNTIELPRVSFANVLNIRGCNAEGRQLEYLNFTGCRDHLE